MLNNRPHYVTTTAELLAAASNTAVRAIRVGVDLLDVPTFRLSLGQTLTGTIAEPALEPIVRFAEGKDGLQLPADNQVKNLTLVSDLNQRALLNDTTVEHLGLVVLQALNVTGLAQMLARGNVRGGHVEAHAIDIVATDARGYEERPKDYGVEVIPGAFTL